MNDALWYALMVEMLDFLAQHKVFQQGWSATARLQGILVVADRYAMVCRQTGFRSRCCLMKFTTSPHRGNIWISYFLGRGHGTEPSGCSKLRWMAMEGGARRERSRGCKVPDSRQTHANCPLTPLILN
jgi:hypothetical protein